MSRSRSPIFFTLLIVLSLLLGACGGTAGTPETAASTAPSTAASTAASTEASASSAVPEAGAASTEASAAASTEASAAASAEASPAASEGSSASAEASQAAGPTTVPTLTPAPNAVVLQYWEMDWGLTPVLQEVVNDFNRQNPDIFVKMTQLSWGDYTQKFLGAISAGNPPDVSGGDGGMPFTFYAQDQILPLDDLYAKWKQDGRFDDLTQWAQDKWNYDGHYVGVSWQIDARAIYYRKDLFEQAGIKPPTTHDELLAAAKQLTDKSKEQYGICVPGKQGSYDTDQFYMTLVLQDGGGLADEQGKPTFDTPEQLQALKFEKELVDAAAPPGTASYDMGQTDQMYQQGKCAMVFQPMGYASLWRLQSQAPELYKKTGVLPVLKGQGPKATQRMVGFYNPWMIYKQSKYPEQAKKFLDFMMQKDNLRKVYAVSGGAHGSVYKSLQNDPLYQKEEMTKELAQQVAQYSVDYWYPNNQAAVGIATIGTGTADLIVNPVLAGARQPEDALKDAQTQLSPLFEKQAQ